MMSSSPVAFPLTVAWLMGVARLMGITNDRCRKCLLWMLWLASMRKRMVAITTATHSFLLNNMAGQTMSGRRQEEGRVGELWINCSVCNVSWFELCHLLDIFLCSVISLLSFISMKSDCLTFYPMKHAAFRLVETGSMVTPGSDSKTQWHQHKNKPIK